MGAPGSALKYHVAWRPGAQDQTAKDRTSVHFCSNMSGNPNLLVGYQAGPNLVKFDYVPKGSPAATLVKSFQQGGAGGNLTAKQWAAVSKLMGSGGAKPSAASAAVAASSASPSGSASGKQAPMMSEIRHRLSKLEKSAMGSGAEDPLMRAARKNSARALRLIACPDELAKQGVQEMPLLPTDSTSARFPMVSSLTTSTNLNAFNTLVECPGQTSFGLVVTDAGFNAVVVLNMGSADMAWNVSDVGSSTVTGYTRRLVPKFHFGYIASCATVQPTAPAVVEYTPASDSVYFPVTDGNGNYALMRMPATGGAFVTLIGGCSLSATPFVSTTTFPLASYSTLTTPSAAMTLTPLFPTTGAAVRSMLMVEGASGAAAGPDASFCPSTCIAANMRVQSLASSLVNKVSAVSYAVAGGREGVYSNVPVWRGYTTSNLPVVPSLALLAARSRQHSMGLLNPDNDAWYAVNVAARLSELEEGESKVVSDLSYIGRQAPDNMVTLANATVQGDAIGTAIPNNLALAGWNNEFVLSVTFFTTGATGAVSIPVQLECYAWNEFQIPSELGLPVRHSTYYAEMKAWLQVVSTYPTLACADSFKDYFKAAWGKVKDFGADVTRRLTRHGKEIVRDALVESLFMAFV